MSRTARARGFTLVELLVALLILSLLALMSYRALGEVLDARERVAHQTEKWQRLAAFFGRFEHDVQLASPQPVRTASGIAPAWLGIPGTAMGPKLEFSRFAAVSGVDAPRRVAYALNAQHEIELWIWPRLDSPPGTKPAHYPVLEGVAQFELQYLDSRLSWVDAWPNRRNEPALPRAVRLRIVLTSGEAVVRVFALAS